MSFGDIVQAAHNKIGANPVLISANVEEAGTSGKVRVVLINDSGATIANFAGQLFVTVWQY